MNTAVQRCSGEVKQTHLISLFLDKLKLTPEIKKNNPTTMYLILCSQFDVKIESHSSTKLYNG